jgi:hypothetical protein
MGVINGTAYWASVTTPNTTFNEDGEWKIDVGNLSESTIANLVADGLEDRIKNKDDERGDYITLKRQVKNRRTGQANSAPDVMDAQKKPILNTLVGNGSIVNVLYRPYDWTYQKRKGRSASLEAVQVLDLVPYGGSASDAFDVVDDGFSSMDEDIIPLSS